MASSYKPTGRRYYRIEFMDQFNARQIKGTKIKEKRVAQQLAAKVEADAARIRAGERPAHPEITGPYLGLDLGPARRTWDEAVKEYLEDLVRRGSPEEGAHVRDCDKQLTKVARDCRWKYLSDPTAEGFTHFLDGLAQTGRAVRTRNKYHQCLSAFLARCAAPPRHWIRANPVAAISRAKGGKASRKRLRRAYTPDEWQRLLAAAPDSRQIVYQVAAFSGLRRSELRRLQKQDCNPTGPRPRWHLRPQVSKNGLPWNLPMLPECAKVLLPIWEAAPRPDSRLLSARQVQGNPPKGSPPPVPKIATLYKDLAAAGIAKVDERGRCVDFHSFRYFFCKQVGTKLPIQVVKKLMRHLTLQMTADLYGDLEMEDVAEEVWDLSALFQPNPAGENVPTSGPTNHPNQPPSLSEC